MKIHKLIAVALVVIILVIAGIYFFIPSTLTVSHIAVAHCSAAGANRTISQKKNWKQFWHGKQHIISSDVFTDSDFFVHQTDTFRVTQLLQNAMQISISGKMSQNKSILLFLPFNKDSVQIIWSYQTTTSLNPFTRIQQYQQAVQTKNNMNIILQRMARFVGEDENVYGFPIHQTSTKDTFLVSAKMETNRYPSTTQVYFLLEKLKAYAKQNGAVQTGYAMMNVTQISNNNYVLMTAIPVDKLLPERGDITYKRMIPGNFLTATVTGGNDAINKAETQMQLYFQDYNRTAMAIPFQYLITDRNKESDTSKWITKLYYPVM